VSLFGFGGARRGRYFVAARLAIIIAFVLVFFVFHPHGTTLDILQGIRVALVVALVAGAWAFRRRRRI
jgi:uncharacterized membrane protein YqjE